IFVNKMFLAILSEAADSGRLPASLAADIRAALPWTRSLDTAADFAATHRTELVLKSADGYGGAEVLFGLDVDQGSWENAIEQALTGQGRWIVQTVVAPPLFELATYDSAGLAFSEYTSSTGVFAIDRRFAGGIHRCDATAGLNVQPSLGAAQGSVHVC